MDSILAVVEEVVVVVGSVGDGSGGDGSGEGGGLCMNIPSFKVHFHKTFMMKTDILGKPLAILHYV